MTLFQNIANAPLDTPTHPELEGRRVFVSGVSNSIGEHIAQGFARQRIRLVLHSSQTASTASGLADSLKSKAASTRLFAAETGGDIAACERLARAALGAFGGLDVIVNLVGPAKPGAGQGALQIEDSVAEALRPALVLSRAVADHARNSGQGATVVHVCLARAGQGAEFARYALLKSGLEAMAQDQARRWFSHDICVYAFIPGMDGEGLDDANIVQARQPFDSAMTAIALNAAAGRSRWLNGVTVAVPA